MRSVIDLGLGRSGSLWRLTGQQCRVSVAASVRRASLASPKPPGSIRTSANERTGTVDSETEQHECRAPAYWRLRTSPVIEIISDQRRPRRHAPTRRSRRAHSDHPPAERDSHQTGKGELLRQADVSQQWAGRSVNMSFAKTFWAAARIMIKSNRRYCFRSVESGRN